MEKEVVISVIVPVFNCEKYVGRCIKSILEQTFSNFELIIVNDGSVDNSAKVIKEFLTDKRIKYIEQENKGPGSARNSGLGLACGKYISFVDSDDYIDNNFLEKLYKNAEKNNSDIAVASIVRCHETFEKWRINYEKNLFSTDKNEQFKIVDYPFQSYIWNKIYSKKLLDKINFKFLEGKYFEDIEALCRLLIACERLSAVSGTNYYYMVNDGNSIVRKLSPKKENDRYENLKIALKSIIKNNIKIKRKQYFINRHVFKFLNFPILKIKEDVLTNSLLFLLFNLIPVFYIPKNTILDIKMFLKKIFSITKIDSRIVLMILFIKLRIKYKTKIQDIEITSSGVNSKKREDKIIASLTSFPDRINSVSKTIKTIMNQTLKADEIVLYLASEQFPNKEKELPKNLLDLCEFGLKIKWTEDIKSYKKIIPALKDYENDLIVTFDDDIYYDKDTIETLYNSYLREPSAIQANRIWRIELKEDKIKPLHSSYLYYNYKNYRKPSMQNTILGCGGVLYPAHSLHKNVFDKEKFMNIIPTQDDIWLWAMAVLNNTKIQLNKGYSNSIITVENTQHTGLAKLNNKNNGGLSGYDAFNLMAQNFPEIIEILKQD